MSGGGITRRVSAEFRSFLDFVFLKFFGQTLTTHGKCAAEMNEIIPRTSNYRDNSTFKLFVE